MSEQDWRLERLSRNLALDRTRFDCGDEVQNNWFHEIAGQAERKSVARTYLALDSESRILGFYTLTGRSLSSGYPGSGTSPRNYSVLYVELARLAIALDFQSQGLGRLLVADSFAKALEIDLVIGVAGLLVKPANEALVAYYEALGLRRLGASGGYLAISCKRIRSALPLYIRSTYTGDFNDSTNF